MIDEQTLRDATARHGDEIPPNTVELPGPSTWPCLLAFGLALSAMGVLTMWVVFYVGCAITAIAALGFFNAVFPREKVWYAEIEEPQPLDDSQRQRIQPALLQRDLPRQGALVFLSRGNRPFGPASSSRWHRQPPALPES